MQIAQGVLPRNGAALLDGGYMQVGSKRAEVGAPSHSGDSTAAPSSNEAETGLDLDMSVTDGCGELCDADTLTLPETTFNLLSTVVGLGVLSVPYAFRLSGYLVFLLVLLVIVVTGHTAKLVGASLNLAALSPAAFRVPPKGRDFSFLALIAFGERGQLLMSIVVGLEVWFALVTFMAMSGVNAHLLLPFLGRAGAVALSTILASACLFLPMRVFSYLSLVSSIAMLIAGGAMAAAAFAVETWAWPPLDSGAFSMQKLWDMPRSVGIIMFCFAGHPCFPIVHECMRDRRAWSQAIDFTFSVGFLYYAGFGAFSFLVFGQESKPSITENVWHIDGEQAWRTLSLAGFLLKIQFTAPLLLRAAFTSICPEPPPGSKEWPWWRLLALALLIAATGLTAAVFSHNVAALVSLTGSLLVMTTSVVFPTLAYCRLAQRSGTGSDEHQLRIWEWLTHTFVAAFGLTMAVLGSAQAAYDLWVPARET